MDVYSQRRPHDGRMCSEHNDDRVMMVRVTSCLIDAGACVYGRVSHVHTDQQQQQRRSGAAAQAAATSSAGVARQQQRRAGRAHRTGHAGRAWTMMLQ